MSLTAVSTVSRTLGSNHNHIEDEYVKDARHRDNFQVAAQETKDTRKEESSGISRQTHQIINDIIQQENRETAQDVQIGSDTTVADDVKLIRNDSGKETAQEDQREHKDSLDQRSHSAEHEDLKQSRLLLDGPGQRYRVEKEGTIPDLQSDREILIQVSPVPRNNCQIAKFLWKVVTIGLNPVDWKGP